MNQENTKTSVAGLRVKVGTGLDLPVKQVAEKRAEKLLAIEEEGSASPLPEKGTTFSS